MTGVYIHIPFCDHICFYCDFPKVLKQGQPVDEYLVSLSKEIKKSFAINPKEKCETIYIGGGTPSALSTEQLSFFLKQLNDLIDVSRLKEFSMETNPSDLQDLSKLKVMYEHGIRRLSIGAQSFKDETLKRIGRTHDCASIIRSVENAQRVGFTNISLDLMFRLPGQDVDEFKYNLSLALKLGVNHLSIYSLILEKHTVFHNLLMEHRLHLPNPEQDREMYTIALEELSNNGWHQYEVSNFAKGDSESLHNKLYWQNDNYFGFGAGAHSYLNAERVQNKQVINDYIKTLQRDELPILRRNRLTKKEQIEEELFLGLRMNEGINLYDSSEKFNVDLFDLYKGPIKKLKDEGLLTEKDYRVFLTKKGLYTANDVFSEFLLAKTDRIA